ncbi:hypothetical protein B0T11DRAFT_271916 [Plectosphaerella cucumerina]|uniref:MICOS complex subunit MIC12 n=1 Tax=Plectosphaerella cucumerina TaxID=40658 RepID=A0A8K0TUD6_9PEZI|nr:hypothetical protein B0T11DRAFT_271916 [Plectosphaerella cucumerina]
MGFTTGVTGGVTLTLGLAYLAVQSHQRNREYQAQLLRSQNRVLNSLLEPVVALPPPSRAEREAALHDNLIDNAKDRWNAEVSNAVHWVQHTNWTDVREGFEQSTSRAWRSVFGDPEPQIEAAKQKISESTREVAREAKGAWDRAKEKAAAAAEARAADAKVVAETRAAEAKRILDAEAAEAKQAARSAAQTTREEGATLFDKAKAEGEGLLQKAKQVVGLVEDKAAEAKTQATNVLTTGTTSPVERALQQRYEPSAPLAKSVNEVLAERYLPTAAKDYSQLRGI